MFNDSDNGQTQYCERCLKWAEKYEKLEQENAKLKNIVEHYKRANERLYDVQVDDFNFTKTKYKHTLQEIKAIAEQILNKNEFVYMNYRDVRQIIRLVTKAEEE